MAALGRVAGLLAAAALALPLAGCWSSNELNNRAFVSVIVVDRTDEGIELTLGIPLTNRLIPGQTGGTGGGGNQRPTAFVTRSGVSLEDALQKIQGDIPRRVAFGQTHSIVMGERFVREGIEPVLEFVARNPFLRLNTNLFMVNGLAKSKVADMPDSFERFFVTVLNGYVRNHQILSTTVKDLMFDKANGGDGALPILRFDGAMPKSGAGPSVGTSGCVLLRKGKLAALLTPEEASAVRVVTGQLKQYTYSIQSPTDGRNIGFYTTSFHMEIKPYRTKSGLGIFVRSTSHVGIIASDSTIDLNKPANIERLEQEIKLMADKTVQRVLEQSKAAETDAFNFARYISVQYPREWKKIKGNWRAYYKDRLEVNVDSVIQLRRVGSSTESLRTSFLDDGTPEKP
ncbi:Ger(x)C family spore germination protein [Cohnella sp. 56]|uniref:Ger(x)C family spore germination protein n=1 Tax=Cohnella sp. 56 TaxID=3113722 RepID=UPI0030E7BB9D